MLTVCFVQILRVDGADFLRVDYADLLRVDCADILLVECVHFRYVTRSARRGRFAPAELASRARDHAVTL